MSKKPEPVSVVSASTGYAALRADIESKISEARRVLCDEEDTLSGPDVWCLKAEIDALKDLLKRDASRTAAQHTNELRNAPNE
jgi:hypothetical protein